MKLLLVGPPGVGKSLFARALFNSRTVMCRCGDTQLGLLAKRPIMDRRARLSRVESSDQTQTVAGYADAHPHDAFPLLGRFNSQARCEPRCRHEMLAVSYNDVLKLGREQPRKMHGELFGALPQGVGPVGNWGEDSEVPGLFVQANGGMLFLDDMHEVAPGPNPLLRVLQSDPPFVIPSGEGFPERRVEMDIVGAYVVEESPHDHPIDKQMRGRFGDVVHIAPLLERPEDAVPLSGFYLLLQAARESRPIVGMSTEAARWLSRPRKWLPRNTATLKELVEECADKAFRDGLLEIGSKLLEDVALAKGWDVSEDMRSREHPATTGRGGAANSGDQETSTEVPPEEGLFSKNVADMTPWELRVPEILTAPFPENLAGLRQ